MSEWEKYRSTYDSAGELPDGKCVCRVDDRELRETNSGVKLISWQLTVCEMEPENNLGILQPKTSIYNGRRVSHTSFFPDFAGGDSEFIERNVINLSRDMKSAGYDGPPEEICNPEVQNALLGKYINVGLKTYNGQQKSYFNGKARPPVDMPNPATEEPDGVVGELPSTDEIPF